MTVLAHFLTIFHEGIFHDGFNCDNMVTGGIDMKKSKRINRNLTFIGVVILGFLLLVFGSDVAKELFP